MSLFSVLSVSASGMAAQRMRAEVATENLANAETTRTAEGGPYRRKDVVFESQAQGSPFAGGVRGHASGGTQGGISLFQTPSLQRCWSGQQVP